MLGFSSHSNLPGSPQGRIIYPDHVWGSVSSSSSGLVFILYSAVDISVLQSFQWEQTFQPTNFPSAILPAQPPRPWNLPIGSWTGCRSPDDTAPVSSTKQAQQTPLRGLKQYPTPLGRPRGNGIVTFILWQPRENNSAYDKRSGSAVSGGWGVLSSDLSEKLIFKSANSLCCCTYIQRRKGSHFLQLEQKLSYIPVSLKKKKSINNLGSAKLCKTAC